MKKIAINSLAFLLTVLLLAAGAWGVWNGIASNRFETALADYRAAGFPTETTELAPKPLRSAENAAELYLKAVAFAAGVPDLKPQEASPVSAKLRDTLSTAADALELMRRAADISKCRYPLTRQGDLQVPHSYGGFLKLARLLAASARCKLEEADIDGAIAELRAVFQAGKSLSDVPGLLSQLVRMTITAIGLEALEEVLPSCPSADAALERVALDSICGATARALQGEVAGILNSALPSEAELDLYASGAENDVVSWVLRSRVAAPYVKLELSLYLDSMKETLEALGKSYPVALATMPSIEARLEKGKGYLLDMLVLKTVGIVKKEAQLAARLKLAKLAALYLDHRRKTGAFPEALAVLAGESLLRDPLTDQEFQAERAGQGLVLASAGNKEVVWKLP